MKTDPTQQAIDLFEQSHTLFDDDTSEADLQSHVIGPILVSVGYASNAISWQKRDNKIIPDLCAFQNREDYKAMNAGKPGDPATCIGEIKRPTVSISGPNLRNSRNSPERQLERYLQNSNMVSPNTIGILTNGYEWRVYCLKNNRIHLLSYAQIQNDGTISGNPSETFQILANTLNRSHAVQPSLVRNLLQLLADPQTSVQKITEMILKGRQGTPRAIPLPSDPWAAQAYHSDWVNQKAWICTSNNSTKPGSGKLFESNLNIGYVEIEFNLENIQKQDMKNARKAFEENCGKAPLLVLAVMRGDNPTAKLGLSYNGTYSMTAEFSVHNAQSTSRITLDKILGETRKNIFDAEKAVEHLSLKPLQQKFYTEIQKWVTDLSGWSGSDADRNQEVAKQTRTAILLNLLRTMFCYILKQEKQVPEGIFWPEEFPKIEDYQSNVLEIFFHHVLNKPRDDRDLDKMDSRVAQLAHETEFLNGSIFAKHEATQNLVIPSNSYRSNDPKNPGLYDIFEKYNWTTDEHSNSETDQSMDPDLLGNILERFVSMLDNPDGTERDRQPDGTYYTPKDIVQEMCIRAMTMHGENFARTNPKMDLNLLQNILVQNAIPEGYKPTCRKTLKKFRHELSQKTFVDLALGSGIFLVEVMRILQEIYLQIDQILGEDGPETHEILESILENQIYGADIQPLAVLISRLRIFLLILTERKKTDNTDPLPNLEARIICAQTLNSCATRQDLLVPDGDAEILQSLETLYGEWFRTHDGERKAVPS